VKIRGRITEGMKVAADFTQIPWVKNQLISKLSVDAYPGTLNLTVEEPKDLKRLQDLKKVGGIELTPEESTFCSANCFRTLIAGTIKGALIIPLVSDYPINKLELVAPVNIKETLSLGTGDILEVDVQLKDPSQDKE
jgi:CTP-dependent riboflavin kinase